MLNLANEPYKAYWDLLNRLRAGDVVALNGVRFKRANNASRGNYDKNESERGRLAHVLQLEATRIDLALLRDLLDAEIEARENDSFQGAGDALRILALLVMKYSDDGTADTLRFWRAKMANFDTYAGGFDVEFVFSLLSPSEVAAVLRRHGTDDDIASLERYDGSAISADLVGWREAMATMYPSEVSRIAGPDHDSFDCEEWARIFGDLENLERYGLMNAKTAESRARTYEEVGKFDLATKQWRLAADDADTVFGQISMLTRAMAATARGHEVTPNDADRLEALRPLEPRFRSLGLGTMAVKACYELAAAAPERSVGRHLFEVAQKWRGETSELPLVGLQAGLAASKRWGDADETSELDAAVRVEQERISR